MIQLILAMNRQNKVEQPVIKKVEEPSCFFGAEKRKTLTLKGKIVNQVKIDTKLAEPNAWFFKNSDHFEHFNEC